MKLPNRGSAKVAVLVEQELLKEGKRVFIWQGRKKRQGCLADRERIGRQEDSGGSDCVHAQPFDPLQCEVPLFAIARTRDLDEELQVFGFSCDGKDS